MSYFLTFDLDFNYFIDKDLLIYKRNKKIKEYRHNYSINMRKCDINSTDKDIDFINNNYISNYDDHHNVHKFCCNAKECDIAYLSMINEQFHVLFDDIDRAEHMFKCLGYSVEINNKDLSMLIFSLYENLEKINNEKECRILQSEINSEIKNLINNLYLKFSEQNYKIAIEIWQKAFFLKKFSHKIIRKIRFINHNNE
ncbi:iron-sulfur cluster co-chaperone HscB C-terminal domain-containing protein [Lyticum sinuosum]|nr:iron-sulfur cluster co-chaperone HscB C-terminal domain-containing protein [Lyticum sinuosum]